MYFTNIKLLDKRITEHGISIEEIATGVDIKLNTFNRRMKSGKFLIGEMHKICSFLKLSPLEAREIFLSRST